MIFMGFGPFLLWQVFSQPDLRRCRAYATQAALKDLVLGIKNYQVEYNRYPISPDSHTDERLESSGKLLACLLGRNVDGLNPRQIAYIEPPAAGTGRGGLIAGEGSDQDRLVDKWGHPYVIWVDGDNDNRIANPDVKNTSPLANRKASAQLVVGVLAYSLGPDGVEGTEDDIVSWRSPFKMEPEPRFRWDRANLLSSLDLIIAGILGLALIVAMAKPSEAT